MPKAGVPISEFCKTEGMVADGRIRSTTTPNGWHRMCRIACGCAGHELEQQCAACGVRAELGDDGRCADAEECKATLRRALNAASTAERLAKVRAGAQERQAEARAASPRAKPSKEGRCEHCGEPTAGGKFRMGHDMKLKGELYRAVRGAGGEPRGPAVEALVECRLRGWDPKDFGSLVGTPLWEAADEVYNKAGKTWLEGRIERRIDG